MTRLFHISAYLMLGIVLFPWSVANAQIKGTTTDTKFANTTIVYRDSNATDARILAQLEQSMGVGDVVRITAAPVRPSVKPAAPITIETPAFDRPRPSIDLSGMTASTASADLSPRQQKIDLAPQILTVEAAPTSATSSVQSSAVKTTSKAPAATGKSVKKTGKIYKHNKRKRHLSWRLFDGPIFEKRAKSKYGCYRF